MPLLHCSKFEQNSLKTSAQLTNDRDSEQCRTESCKAVDFGTGEQHQNVGTDVVKGHRAHDPEEQIQHGRRGGRTPDRSIDRDGRVLLGQPRRNRDGERVIE